MNNYTSSTGSSTGSNSGTQKHLVPSGSFLKSGTKSAAPTSAQTGQSSSQPAQSYTQPTQSYTQASQTYSQPAQAYTQTTQTYSQTVQSYTETASGFTPSEVASTTEQSAFESQPAYTQSSQAYAQTGRVEASSAQLIDSPNMFLGIIGMLLGLALATGLVTLLYSLYHFSKAQLIAACFIYILAVKGYILLGKGIDLKGTIICSVCVLIMVYFSHEIAMAFHLQQYLGENVNFTTAYKSIKLFLELNPDQKKWYYLELGAAYFINIACVIMGPTKVFAKRQ